ncbi:9286_t:CDS:2, partial [Entrophospora sp. SA101]
MIKTFELLFKKNSQKFLLSTLNKKCGGKNFSNGGNGTSSIMSRSQEMKDHPKDNPEYFERRKIIALENYKKKQAKKQRVRLKHLITIYHNISNFINLENLDEKIEDIFDMQMDYIESGGGINANEARRRIESIKDALYGTSHGGKYPGLKMIENWAKEN